jgi:hypothetical protein
MYRLYGCLRLACGWILWHMRRVDDGIFRRHVCEALLVCYMLQALAALRGELTTTTTSSSDEEEPQRKTVLVLNWVAILVLLALSVAYASFRFGKGGNRIKIYELPTSATFQ